MVATGIPAEWADGSPSLDTLLQWAKSCSQEGLDELRCLYADDSRKGLQKAFEAAQKRLDKAAALAAALEARYVFEAQLAQDAGAALWCGLDEVGRGPVAGPLAAGAVVLEPDYRIEGLNDSKQVSPDERRRIAEEIKAHSVAWAIQYVSNEFIDAHGMTLALRTAFSGAVAQIEEQGVVPQLLLLDGNPLRFDPREKNIVKGDAKCASIAAASIIAKVARDDLMVELARDYPEYHWEQNKGYASEDHREAIARYGLTPLHRASFCTNFQQMSLF